MVPPIHNIQNPTLLDGLGIGANSMRLTHFRIVKTISTIVKRIPSVLTYCTFVTSVIGQRGLSTFRQRNRIGSPHCQGGREIRDANAQELFERLIMKKTDGDDGPVPYFQYTGFQYAGS